MQVIQAIVIRLQTILSMTHFMKTKKKTDGRGHKSVSGMEIMNSKDSCAMIIPEFEGNKVKEDVK